MAGRPNVLLLVADQLTPRVLGCYGGPVPTPNIDRLAAEGARFAGATCPTPFCSPSRASLATGRLPHNHGIVHNVMRRDYPAVAAPPTEEGITAADVTMGRLFHGAGYDTHHYGKWHLMDGDLPYYPDMYREHREYAREMAGRFRAAKDRPREDWLDWYGWALPVDVDDRYRAAVADADLEGRGQTEFLAKMGRLAFERDEAFDYRVADRAVERLGAAAEPFFVTASFNWPHDPNVVPDPYYSRFDPDDLALPDNYGAPAPRFADDPSRTFPAAVGERGVREFLRVYYGMVAFVDEQVGRVLDALDERGVADGTVVAFTADHGDMCGGHGMVWKGTDAFYEEVVRVPLLVRGPGVVPGERTMAAGLTDLLPTLLDLAGHGDRTPEAVDGRSLAPWLRDAADPADAPTYALAERIAANPEHTRRDHPGDDAFMLRGDGWKYARYPDGAEFLYDLDADPGETTNRAGDPDHDGVRERLAGELDDRLAATGYGTD